MPSKLKLLKRFIQALVLSVFFSFGLNEVKALDIYHGQVERVLDGDTISVLTTDFERIRVRLYGIDAPEKSQPGADESRNSLSNLIMGKNVVVESLDTDRYSRLVALVVLDDVLVNLYLVEQGHAWVYEYYCKVEICKAFREAQNKAQKAKIGLWKDPAPVAPWEHRKKRRSGK
ncbi:MAG: thermonuclease family protein [Deltaproteobacteria bacterium]|jgi:endonuclease YncB( thermonuclease family)|nr:thermonuclease family protein [Deltaproteobacteria bacterium]